MSFALQYSVSYLIVDALCLVISLIIAKSVSNDVGSETQNRHFLNVLVAFDVFVVCDAIWGLLACSGFFTLSPLILSLVNCICLSSVACAGYFWICFTLSYLGNGVSRNWLVRFAPAIPALLVPVLHAIGYVINQNVIMLPDGTMRYGWIHLIIDFITLVYIFGSTYISAREYRRAQTKAKRSMCLVFMSFMAPFIVAGLIDIMIANTPIAAAGITASLTLVAMSMQESRISSDALTGLNNRRRADAYLEESVGHVSPDRPLRLFLLDLNKFKSINDTYGHLEGDRALCLTADALRLVCTQVDAFAARWGGDEFVVIQTKASDSEPGRVSAIIKDALAEKAAQAKVPYQLTCSVGFASCEDSHEDCNSIVARADEMLYQAKRELHAR